MPSFRNGPLLAVVALSVCACSYPHFVPGPGMSALDLEPDQARCRLIARGLSPGFEYGASGSTRDVAAYMAAATIASGIETAIQNNMNYNDCMEARGWRVAEKEPDDGVVTVPRVAEAPVAMNVVTSTVTNASSELERRKPFGIVGVEVNDDIAESARLDPPRGVLVTSVKLREVAADGGMRAGDIILMVDGTYILSEKDLKHAVADVAAGRLVHATVWRNAQEQGMLLQF